MYQQFKYNYRYCEWNRILSFSEIKGCIQFDSRENRGQKWLSFSTMRHFV